VILAGNIPPAIFPNLFLQRLGFGPAFLIPAWACRRNARPVPDRAPPSASRPRRHAQQLGQRVGVEQRDPSHPQTLGACRQPQVLDGAGHRSQSPSPASVRRPKTCRSRPSISAATSTSAQSSTPSTLRRMKSFSRSPRARAVRMRFCLDLGVNGPPQVSVGNADESATAA
jgi:hypothetical protein